MTNPFDASMYQDCLTADCENKVNHRSGYCTKCRTQKCSVCNVQFVGFKMFEKGFAKCGLCKCKNKRKK